MKLDITSTENIRPHNGCWPHRRLFRSFFMEFFMTLSLSIGPIVSLIAGILILVMPRLLSTIVAVYLIIMGIVGLLGMQALRF